MTAAGSSQDNFSVYSLHDVRWRSFLLQGGIRYNGIVNRVPKETLDPSDKSGYVNMKTSAVVGNAAMPYLISANHLVYVSVSNGYRAPGLDDISSLGLVDFRYEVPVYDSQPEKNINTEIGYRIKSEKLQFSAGGFYMQIRDLISRHEPMVVG